MKFLRKVKNGDSYIMFPLKFINVPILLFHAKSSILENENINWIVIRKKVLARTLSFLNDLDTLTNITWGLSCTTCINTLSHYFNIINTMNCCKTMQKLCNITSMCLYINWYFKTNWHQNLNKEKKLSYHIQSHWYGLQLRFQIRRKRLPFLL
jgi:hypothetical protein